MGGGGIPYVKKAQRLWDYSLAPEREVMSKDELKTFLTIHIREGE